MPDASGYIKLDAMENPYQLPAALRAELGARLADAVLNRYPVPTYATLKQKIRAQPGRARRATTSSSATARTS